MKCPKCQAENREGAKFCDECGGKLELVCSECGKTNRVGAKYCDDCGHDLRKPDETKPLDFTQPQSYTPKHLADKIFANRSAIERSLENVKKAERMFRDMGMDYWLVKAQEALAKL